MATGTDVTKLKIALIDPTLSCFGKTLLTLAGHDGYITAISFSFNDALLITGSLDNSAIIWGMDSNHKETYGKVLARLYGHTGHVSDACFSPDCELVVTSGLINFKPRSVYGVIIWKLDKITGTYTPRKKLVHFLQVRAVRFSNDGKMLATLCSDNISFIYNSDLASEDFGMQIAKMTKGNNSWIQKYPNDRNITSERREKRKSLV